MHHCGSDPTNRGLLVKAALERAAQVKAARDKALLKKAAIKKAAQAKAAGDLPGGPDPPGPRSPEVQTSARGRRVCSFLGVGFDGLFGLWLESHPR